jgi:hypothetical protein
VKHGAYGKLQARPGQRDALAAILLRAARLMKDALGCSCMLSVHCPTISTALM